jgi:serine/threonine protein kinase
MYALLTGTAPFYWAGEKEMGCLVQQQPILYPRQQFGAFSDGCMDLLKRMLEKDRDVRITTAVAMAHSWLANTSG